MELFEIGDDRRGEAAGFGSEEEFIAERYWGKADGGCVEHKVEYPLLARLAGWLFSIRLRCRAIWKAICRVFIY
jgi:hypothetical protein